MTTKVTEKPAESVEEYDMLKQADALLQYKDWEIARLRACIDEMQEMPEECRECRARGLATRTI